MMNIHIVNDKKIFVTYDYDRAFWNCEPWVAVYEGYDGAPVDYETPSEDPLGLGYTEQEAIDNLIEITL